MGALFDHSPFAIQIFTPNGQTRHVNRTYTKLWGLRGEQLARFRASMCWTTRGWRRLGWRR
jgi:PAS domain-containing protein